MTGSQALDVARRLRDHPWYYLAIQPHVTVTVEGAVEGDSREFDGQLTDVTIYKNVSTVEAVVGAYTVSVNLTGDRVTFHRNLSARREKLGEVARIEFDRETLPDSLEVQT